MSLARSNENVLSQRLTEECRPLPSELVAPADTARKASPVGAFGTMLRGLRRGIDLQLRLSRLVDNLLPASVRVYGRKFFREVLVPQFVARGQRVYDVGGGANPFLSAAEKEYLGVSVVGLDIAMSELARAPAGCYDATVCADIACFAGKGDADIVICQSVLEHVPDVRSAFAGLASILKPGGRLLLFVPCRNAPFARLNLLLPDGFKRRLLFAIYPEKRRSSGFRVFYDHCTPRDFHAFAKDHGLGIELEREFFMTSYFFAFFPAYLLWRMWTLIAAGVIGPQAASTFCIVLRRTVD